MKRIDMLKLILEVKNSNSNTKRSTVTSQDIVLEDDDTTSIKTIVRDAINSAAHEYSQQNHIDKADRGVVSVTNQDDISADLKPIVV